MKIVVTEVTNMRAGMHCVAGYNIDDKKMVRPKPNGTNWTAQNISDLKVEVGSLLNLGESCKPQTSSLLPHRNEDFIINLDDVTFGGIEHPSPTASNSVQECFDGQIHRSRKGYQGYFGAYVEDQSDCPSLGGLIVSKRDFKLYHDTYGGKTSLKAKFIDKNLDKWNLKVTSTNLSNINPLELLQYQHELPNEIHLRLGLARRFPAQEFRCFLQLNGILM